MSPLDQITLDPPTAGSELREAALASLRSGRPFTSLLIDGAASRFTALESVLCVVAGPETRIVQISNPLRSALTLDRLLIQAVGPELDPAIERTDEQLATLLARPLGDEQTILIVIHQPETLGAETREVLGRMAAYFPALTPRVQVLFCGSTAFRPPAPAREPARALVPALTIEAEPSPPRGRPLLPLLLFLAMLTACGAVLWNDYPEWFAPLRHVWSQVMVQPPPAEPNASPDRRPPPADDVAALRHEFDGFLNERAPALASLSQVQKDALIREFLARRRTQPRQPEP